MLVFKYKGWSYATDNPNKMDEFLETWIQDHWDLFVEWTNYLVTEDNYEAYAESFGAETITEVSE